MNIGRRIEILQKKWDYIMNVDYRNLWFNYKILKNPKCQAKEKQIIGIMRERNEGLLLNDTLNHMSNHVDGVIVFDDASDDDSVEIALKHPLVIEVIVNKKWKRTNRIWEETANRKLLYKRARKYRPSWFFYFDADERFEGDIKRYLQEKCPQGTEAIKISLFDAYITPEDKSSYNQGELLYNFRKLFGPERRDILMIWRNNGKAAFNRPDAREPHGFLSNNTDTLFYCQHYGKSLSIEHWEETCRYYSEFFPKYSQKWKARMGKAVHEYSDFDNQLYSWNDVKKNSITMDDAVKRQQKIKR